MEVTGCVAWPGVGRFTPWATPVAGCAAGRGSAIGAIVGGTVVPAAGGVAGGWVAAGTAGVGVVGGTISAMGGGATAWGGMESKVIVSVSGEAETGACVRGCRPRFACSLRGAGRGTMGWTGGII